MKTIKLHNKFYSLAPLDRFCQSLRGNVYWEDGFKPSCLSFIRIIGITAIVFLICASIEADMIEIIMTYIIVSSFLDIWRNWR